MNKVTFFKILSDRKDNTKGVPLVVIYHPGLKNIDKIINRNLQLLYMDQEVKKVFIPKPMVSFRNTTKYHAIPQCHRCLNVNKTDSFARSVTRKGYKINHYFNCNEKCLICLLTCKIFLKQYVGQTVDELRLRWNNYKSDNRNHQRFESCMQEHLFEHSNEEGHQGFSEDVSITFIDKTDPSEPLKRENYWKSALKTMRPLGFNV